MIHPGDIGMRAMLVNQLTHHQKLPARQQAMMSSAPSDDPSHSTRANASHSTQAVLDVCCETTVPDIHISLTLTPTVTLRDKSNTQLTIS